jgi:LAO/AO transport system kinase
MNNVVEGVRKGDSRFIARLISMVENEDPGRIPVLKELRAGTGSAHIIGITGPPGSGKSTLTDKLVTEFRLQDKKTAVLAVDPSSPFSGGAILGDRIRMMRHAADEKVYIRSLATRGHLGGISQAVCESVRVLDAAGFDTIIVETVGVGQSEVDIVRCADTVVLVSVPGLGDDIQAIKAGVMEIGDIFVVNKADRDGADMVVRELRSMLENAADSVTRFSELLQARSCVTGKPLVEGSDGGAFHHAQAGRSNLQIPPVIKTNAETGTGVKELAEEIQAHAGDLRLTGLFLERRKNNIAWELKDALSRKMLRGIEENNAFLSCLAGSVLEAKTDFYDALDRLAGGLNIQLTTGGK